MTEKQFESQVKRFLKSEGVWHIKYWGGGIYTKAGIPDLFVCCNGRFVAVELKSGSGRATKMQLYHLEKIRESGGIAYVLSPSGFEGFKEMIRGLKNDRSGNI